MDSMCPLLQRNVTGGYRLAIKAKFERKTSARLRVPGNNIVSRSVLIMAGLDNVCKYNNLFHFNDTRIDNTTGKMSNEYINGAE